MKKKKKSAKKKLKKKLPKWSMHVRVTVSGWIYVEAKNAMEAIEAIQEKYAGIDSLEYNDTEEEFGEVFKVED